MTIRATMVHLEARCVDLIVDESGPGTVRLEDLGVTAECMRCVMSAVRGYEKQHPDCEGKISLAELKLPANFVQDVKRAYRKVTAGVRK